MRGKKRYPHPYPLLPGEDGYVEAKAKTEAVLTKTYRETECGTPIQQLLPLKNIEVSNRIARMRALLNQKGSK